MSLAVSERAAICDEFASAGPSRPTLCGGWSARELLAHLLVRERAPWIAPAIVIPALAGVAARAMRSWDATPWEEQIRLLRGGAPVWSPFAVGKLDELANGAEFFVHHEDVRRGVPGWAPRPGDPARDEQVWAILRRMGRLFYRSSPVGVALRTPDGRDHTVKPGPGVTVVGEPGELLLHASGRSAVQVQVEGVPADIATFEAASRGM